MCYFCPGKCPGHYRKLLTLQNQEGSRKNYRDSGSMGRCTHLSFSGLRSYPGAFSEGRYLEAPEASQASGYRYSLAEKGHLSISITG